MRTISKDYPATPYTVETGERGDWFDLDGGSVALGTASGTVATSTSFSARWLRAVVKLDSGTGTVTVRVHASNEAA